MAGTLIPVSPLCPIRRRGSLGKNWRYTLGLGILVSAIVCWWLTRGGGDWSLRIFSLIFALLALGLFVEQETRVDTITRTLCREGRLFGHFRVWLRRRSLSEFNAVEVRTCKDADGQATVFVELLRPSGRPIAVQYLYGQATSEARSIARRLAEATGLPVHEDKS